MMHLIQQGGPMTLVIIGISFIAATIFFERAFHLHRAQIRAGDFLQGIFNIIGRGTGDVGGRLVEAISICDETPGPVSQMVRAAILAHDQSPAHMRQAMETAGLAEIPRLERHLGLLLSLAQAAPLCGLLGTVLGLIEVLGTIHAKAPLIHAGDLGGGMWQALISSAAGLIVAIPTYFGYNLLVSRVESVVLEMERVFPEVLTFFRNRENGQGK